MPKRYGMLYSLLAVVVSSLLLNFDSVHAQPTVKLILDPDVRTIPLNSGIQEIVITTQTGTQNLHFSWKLYGPGRLEGGEAGLTGPGILYIPPDRVDTEGKKVIVRVTVKDNRGKTATDQVTFTFLATQQRDRQRRPTPQPGPTMTPKPIPTVGVSIKEADERKLDKLLGISSGTEATPEPTATLTATPETEEGVEEKLDKILKKKED